MESEIIISTDNQQLSPFPLAESNNFNSILNVMYHTKKQEGRLYLNMMDNILDYIQALQVENGTINYHIIHIPACPDWGRVLLLRFIIHKVALTQNRTTINRFSKSIQKIIINNNPKEVRLIQNRNKYFRNLIKTFDKEELPCNRNKSLIITKELDLITNKSDKNPWLNEFFSREMTDDNHNIVLSTETTAYDIEKALKDSYHENILTIDYIIIFHSTNKNKLINSYNKDQLERLNKYGLGIKNCIVFSFSEEPFQLYHIIYNVKYRLASSLLNKTISKYDEFAGFITFSQNEIDSFFNRKKKQKTFFIDCEKHFLFTYEIDKFIGQSPYCLKYKNILAIAFTDELKKYIIQSIIKDIKDFPKRALDDYFNLIKLLWADKLKDEIETFIGKSPNIAFIMPFNIIKSAEQLFSSLFQKNNRVIRFYSIEDLKKKINADKLIILQYRYTEKLYKSYPNSFDPLPLKSTQEALIVINKITHGNYYEWNNCQYKKDRNRLFFSNFRYKFLGWQKESFQCNSLPDAIDYISESENEERNYQTEKCRIYYKDFFRECLASERIVYKDELNKLHIAKLKEVVGLNDISIQFLDEITSQVKELITVKSNSKTISENVLRQNPKFALTKEEIESPIELWKILLKKEVKNRGEQAVYEAIFSTTPQNERISMSTFNQWYNTENLMVLPRSRKHQKALLTYLGFELGSAYHLTIIIKKLSNRNNSRLLNSKIETLLREILVNKINKSTFNSLLELHSDIFTLLGINNIEDLDILLNLLEISLKPIERIEYD